MSDKLYEVVANIYDTHAMYISYAILIGISLALVLGIPLLDKVRMLITNPICNMLCNIWNCTKIKLKIYN